MLSYRDKQDSSAAVRLWKLMLQPGRNLIHVALCPHDCDSGPQTRNCAAAVRIAVARFARTEFKLRPYFPFLAEIGEIEIRRHHAYHRVDPVAKRNRFPNNIRAPVELLPSK